MTEDKSVRKERRKIGRFLCSESFSESCLQVGEQQFQLISVNYNRYGIALYTHQRLPDNAYKSSAMISFYYQQESEQLRVTELPCEIRNRHETEVGHQYGIQFSEEALADPLILEQLVKIENLLQQINTPENRYGLFDL